MSNIYSQLNTMSVLPEESWGWVQPQATGEEHSLTLGGWQSFQSHVYFHPRDGRGQKVPWISVQAPQP